MTEQLKPCPKCGKDWAMLDRLGWGGEYVLVRCRYCPHKTAAKDTEKEAIAAWNERIEPTDVERAWLDGYEEGYDNGYEAAY